ncbi:hypothetical protein MSI_14440 [Treponema sp. JC4]|uniref:hypothetical protein n=1 Tax=Treponema sp. JC4 TaxID=1124982 RepID=UPI00025B02E0|nr:hypothetical protein [Treponema sp. JC4]EID85058.1 hypothetical protein MSI_14440 [Treponema sp. JC4]
MIKTGKNSLAFSYKAGNSPLHKMPAWLKILLIPALNILIFNLPLQFALAFILLQAILAFALHFTPRELFADLRPVLYYAVILYATSFIATFFAACQGGLANPQTTTFTLVDSLKLSLSSSFKNTSTIRMLVKLFCILQSASILFKTSTTLQIREGLGAIESAVRKILPVSKKNRFTPTASLFICFIPMVYKNWELSRRAWLARGGKSGIKMLKAIFPVFLSVGIKQAYNAARALAVRSHE